MPRQGRGMTAICLSVVRSRGAFAGARAHRIFSDARGAAATVAKIIELGAADAAFAHDLDLVDDRAKQRKYAFNAFTERNLAHGERGIHAGVLSADANAFIGLRAF